MYIQILMHVIAHRGVQTHVRVCTESGLWEKNPLPHRGIEPASTVCGFDAVPTELHPNPIIISLKGPNTEPSVLRRRKGGRRLVVCTRIQTCNLLIQSLIPSPVNYTTSASTLTLCWFLLYVSLFSLSIKQLSEAPLGRSVYDTPFDMFLHTWPWANSCLTQRHEWVSRFYVWYYHKSSPSRKPETTQYNTAELDQPRQNMTAAVHWDMACEQVMNRGLNEETFSDSVCYFFFLKGPEGCRRCP